MKGLGLQYMFVSLLQSLAEKAIDHGKNVTPLRWVREGLVEEPICIRIQMQKENIAVAAFCLLRNSLLVAFSQIEIDICEFRALCDLSPTTFTLKPILEMIKTLQTCCLKAMNEGLT